ncbi:unnamed protein product [Rotaria sordida]|uniref:Uncharacterized protein n=1 Tax=Rotaria sordida TaxID=392033 RepID=A0A814NWB2_9BILA|nr:unnamed protein product [Rotaria sordida]CAF3898633.1 unnamed protein product [Rotaria sordida]
MNSSTIFPYDVDEGKISSPNPSNYYEQSDSFNNFENNIGNSSILKGLNELNHRINNISINELTFLKNVEEWRRQSHQIIDQFCKDISNKYINRTKEEFNHLRNLTALMINNHDTTKNNLDWIKQTIKLIEQNLDQLKYIQYQFDALEIDKSIISLPSPMKDIQIPSFSQSNHLSLKKEIDTVVDSSSSNNSISSSVEILSYHYSLSPQNRFYPNLISSKRMIDFSSDNWFTLATNQMHMVAIGKSILCLFNQNLNIIRQKSFQQQGIKDICWSETLDRFIFISAKEIFTLDEETMVLNPYNIYFNTDSTWERITCSESTLFLSTFGQNPFIAEFIFYPSIHFQRRYQSEIISHENEMINDIKYSDNNLGIIIENGLTNQSHLEVRSMKSFECIWMIVLGRGWGYRCSLFNHRYWITVDRYNHRCIYILNDGTLIKTENYSSKPFNVVSWGKHQLVIRTMQTLNIHECE